MSENAAILLTKLENIEKLLEQIVLLLVLLIEIQFLYIFLFVVIKMAVVRVNRWQIGLILYLVVIAIILIIKPAMMFTAEERPKVWGADTTEDVSVFSPMIVFPLLGFVCYYIGVWIELMYQ